MYLSNIPANTKKIDVCYYIFLSSFNENLETLIKKVQFSSISKETDNDKWKRYKKRKRKHYRSTRKYWRTVRNVRIVYPYAEEANNTIVRLNEQLKNVHSKKERRKLIRKEYKGLMKEYKKPLMKLKIKMVSAG